MTKKTIGPIHTKCRKIRHGSPTLRCDKSPEHVDSKDPQRQRHSTPATRSTGPTMARRRTLMADELEYDRERGMAVRRRVHWVPCPTCGAPDGAGCRSRVNGHPTTLHQTRIRAAGKAVDADRAKPQVGRIRWTVGTLKGFVGDTVLFEVSDVRHAGQGWGLRSLVGEPSYTSGHVALDDAKGEAERILAEQATRIGARP